MRKIEKSKVYLDIVSLLFLIVGFSSIIKVIFSAYNGQLCIDWLGVVSFFIGIGLLKRKKKWRIGAIIMLWVYMIWIFSFISYVFYSDNLNNLYYYIFDQKNLVVSRSCVMGVLIAIFLLFFWEYRVLLRKDVKALFERLEEDKIGDGHHRKGVRP